MSLLLPPGAGVHTWQPRPGDIVRLAECDLLLYHRRRPRALASRSAQGLSRRPHPDARSRGGPRGRRRARGRGTTARRGHGHGPLDPHVWLDFELDVRIVGRIADELARIDPAGGPEFAANAGRLTARLKELDAEFRDGLAGCRGRDIVLAGHGAFGYLARRYGLVQTALYGLSPDAQPTPRDLMKAVDFCRRKGIRTIFFENSVPPDLSRTLAREIGGRALVLHAGHNLTRDQQARGVGFFDLMEENLAALKDGLGCR